MKGKPHDLNHDLTFSAHTINCVCHSIRSMFRVLGICNFGLPVGLLRESLIFDFNGMVLGYFLSKCQLITYFHDYWLPTSRSNNYFYILFLLRYVRHTGISCLNFFHSTIYHPEVLRFLTCGAMARLAILFIISKIKHSFPFIGFSVKKWIISTI